MGYERIIAGTFAGIGGLLSITLGVMYDRAELLLAGSNLLIGMMAFFVGENNGVKKAQA